jgi:hypothetical protein
MPRDRMRGKRPQSRAVPVHLDPELVDAYNVAALAVEEARLHEDAGEARVAELIIERDRLKEAVDAETVELTLTAIGRKAYDALLDGHPPTDEQNAEHMAEHGGRTAPYNGDTFPVALVHASLTVGHGGAVHVVGGEVACEGGEFSYGDVVEWFDEWNGAELMELFAVAMEVNSTRRVAGLGNG